MAKRPESEILPEQEKIRVSGNSTDACQTLQVEGSSVYMLLLKKKKISKNKKQPPPPPTTKTMIGSVEE